MSPVSSQILWCLPWKQALVLLSLFLELTAECSPAAIQLQAPSLLRCEQLGPLCASGVRLVLQLSENAFLTTGYISAFPLKPCSYTGTLSSTKSTSKLCLAVEHHICFPFIVWDVFRTSMITFHLIFKKESKHTQTKKLFPTGWVPSPPTIRLEPKSELFFWSLWSSHLKCSKWITGWKIPSTSQRSRRFCICQAPQDVSAASPSLPTSAGKAGQFCRLKRGWRLSPLFEGEHLVVGAKSLSLFQAEGGVGHQSKVLPTVALVYRHQCTVVHMFLCTSGHRGGMDVDCFLWAPPCAHVPQHWHSRCQRSIPASPYLFGPADQPGRIKRSSSSTTVLYHVRSNLMGTSRPR